MVKIKYELTDDEKFEIYKSVKRNLQKHYYENRTEEQIEKRKKYMQEYKKKNKGVKAWEKC